jgi:hypothetical protein
VVGAVSDEPAVGCGRDEISKSCALDGVADLVGDI